MIDVPPLYVTVIFLILFIGTWFIFLSMCYTRHVNKNNKFRFKSTSSHKSQAIKNLHNILEHFVELDQISNPASRMNHNTNDNAPESILDDLNQYYTRHQKQMISLLDTAPNNLFMWLHMDYEKISAATSILVDFNWLVNSYFIIEKDKDAQIKMWGDLRGSVSEKRFKIDKIISTLCSDENVLHT